MSNSRNKKHENRVKKLVAMVVLCAIVLAVSTYAWFIGMKTVNLSKFDINIKTTEGLYLSMDGKSWTYNLEGVKTAESYEKNTNTFAEKGLVPMSTVGDMDKTSSTMKLFEKGSLTSTPGGMRLLASQVKNNTIDTEGGYVTGKEGEGYVSFDLFIKNLSGEEYYAENNPLNEEAIYLTTNSGVKVLTTGEGQENADKTGIENSIRVGFAQIGRVNAGIDNDKELATITSMTCADNKEKEVTGICRNAQIWEPNDTKHVQNALNWYKTSCLQRNTDGAEVTSKDSYGDACAELELTKAYPTYAISRAINIEDKVNIYDGTAFNTYEKNSTTYDAYKGADDTAKADMKLVEYPYFTDTMKMKTSVDRPEFMTLAPNSITKVRVYIWLEGQDIDNYDFASLGKQVAINFGFTKERFTEGDVNYEGPSTDITDKTETPEPTPGT